MRAVPADLERNHGRKDHEGERRHALDLAAAPEYGKKEFLQRLEREIARAKQPFPTALSPGIADAAASNWRFLEPRTDRRPSDFFHATESVGKVAQARYRQRQAAGERVQYQHEHGRKRKHDPDGRDLLVGEAARLSPRHTLSRKVREDVLSAWTYCTNHRRQMDYPGFLAARLPIGSGVAEAACKTLVKQRLCACGMRWKNKGAKRMLSLRAPTHTTGRWAQFWPKIDRFGAECCG